MSKSTQTKPAGKSLSLAVHAFAGQSDDPTRLHEVLVEADGSILVYDGVAGHFTRRHEISPQDEIRIRRRARGAIALARPAGQANYNVEYPGEKDYDNAVDYSYLRRLSSHGYRVQVMAGPGTDTVDHVIAAE